MMFTKTTFLTTALTALVLAPKAVFGTVFITAPVATTTCQGGQKCTISWEEDQNNTPPLLANWGTASVGVFVGSTTQQTQLQFIQDGVNVAANSGIVFTVDPTIGPNSNAYFIRFASDTVMDPQNPQFPVESFSAKFTLSGMSGQFNATVQAQINGASGVTTGPASTSAPSTTTSNPASNPASKPTTGTSTSKSSSSSPAATGKKSAGVTTVNALNVLGMSAPLAVILAALF